MGTALKIIMAQNDITNKELAAATGISYRTICEIVNGYRKPNIDTCYKIADCLELHINRVFPNYYSYDKLSKKRIKCN